MGTRLVHIRATRIPLSITIDSSSLHSTKKTAQCLAVLGVCSILQFPLTWMKVKESHFTTQTNGHMLLYQHATHTVCMHTYTYVHTQSHAHTHLHISTSTVNSLLVLNGKLDHNRLSLVGKLVKGSRHSIELCILCRLDTCRHTHREDRRRWRERERERERERSETFTAVQTM